VFFRSNCVLSLIQDKKAVLQEAYNALKMGGEMHFSAMYADSNMDENMSKEGLLWSMS